ncbi:hypothetical protein P3L10_001666 [Capsicum annuum]
MDENKKKLQDRLKKEKLKSDKFRMIERTELLKYILQQLNVQADLDAFKDGRGNNFFRSTTINIYLNDIDLKRAGHDGDKNNDIEQEIERFKNDGHHMNESEEEFNCLEMDSNSEWLGVWDNTEKDEAIVQVIEKKKIKQKVDEKKNLKDSAKWRKIEKTNDKVMKESKNTNFAEEDSYSEAENGNISSENDELEDMRNINNDNDQVENIVFREDIDMANPTFSLGMTFINAIELREALRVYSVKNNREISLKKNASSKISTKYSDRYP